MTNKLKGYEFLNGKVICNLPEKKALSDAGVILPEKQVNENRKNISNKFIEVVAVSDEAYKKGIEIKDLVMTPYGDHRSRHYDLIEIDGIEYACLDVHTIVSIKRYVKSKDKTGN